MCYDLLLSLFVVLVALPLATCCSSLFEVTVDPLLAPLVVDVTAESFEIYVVNNDAGLLTSIRVSFFRFHVFILSWNLFMSMLGSQAGPPILTNPPKKNIN